MRGDLQFDCIKPQTSFELVLNSNRLQHWESIQNCHLSQQILNFQFSSVRLFQTWKQNQKDATAVENSLIWEGQQNQFSHEYSKQCFNFSSAFTAD